MLTRIHKVKVRKEFGALWRSFDTRLQGGNVGGAAAELKGGSTSTTKEMLRRFREHVKG
jgi:hypothetical protein